MKMLELSKSNLTKLVGIILIGFVVWLIVSCSATVNDTVVIEEIVEPIEPVIEPVVEPVSPSDTTQVSE